MADKPKTNVDKFFEIYDADPALQARVQQAMDCYPGSLEISDVMTEHVLLPGGTRGRVDYDGSFVPVPLGGRGERLGLSLQTAQGQQRCERTGQHAVQLFHTFD